MTKWTDMLKKPAKAVQAQEIPKVTITFKRRYIEVNGITFELLKSDADMLDDALKLIDKSEKLDPKDSRAVLENLHEMASYIDTILGEGALMQITGGIRVGYVEMLDCMQVIVGAVYEAYQTALASKYGK